MFGVLIPFYLCLVSSILLLLLIISFVLLGCFLMKNYFELFSSFYDFYVKIQTQFNVFIWLYEVRILKSIFLGNFNFIYYKTRFFITLHVLILLRMELSNVKIGIFLKQSTLLFQMKILGLMLCLLLVFRSITYIPLFFIVVSFIIFCLPLNLYFLLNHILLIVLLLFVIFVNRLLNWNPNH